MATFIQLRVARSNIVPATYLVERMSFYRESVNALRQKEYRDVAAMFVTYGTRDSYLLVCYFTAYTVEPLGRYYAY